MPAITVENLSKSYLVGHNTAQTERYTALRDVLARNARNLARKTRDMFQGRAIVQGDEVEEFWALKDVSFEVKRGETLGIIGRNGAGKSTLLKVLSRITEPTKGRITIRGRVASLLEVGTGFHPELTGRENMFLNGAILGMTRAEIRRRFDEIVAFAEVERFLDTPVKRYSSGMYVRLAFAVAAHLEPEILIVDEVLAVGDVAFQQKCLGKMSSVAKQGRTVLFVSHNMPAITQLCDHGILLDRGTVHQSGLAKNVVSSYLSRIQALNPSSTFPRKNGTPVQYVAVSVKDNADVVSSVIADTQGFTIEFDVAVYEVVANIYFGLVLVNSEGLDILFADSRDHERAIADKLKPGRYRYRLQFPPIFRPDKYSINVGIADAATLRRLEFVDFACTFEVAQSGNIQRTSFRSGLINLRLTWNSGIVKQW